MTFNSFYNGIVQNLFFGGIAAAIIVFVLFRKANQVAATGNKAKMIGWSVAPAMMVIVAVLAHGVALGVVWPRVQGAFTSAPVQNTMDLGNEMTALVDNVLWGGGGVEMNVAAAGAAAFKAPVMEASAPVNGGITASFVGQPVNIQANTERVVETAAEAVAAINAIGATPTAVGGGLTYINQFVADNKPVDTAIACNGSYTIKRGDSLAKIARACYGDSGKWRLIWEANRSLISDPNSIRAGVTLTIPAGNGAPTSAIVNSQAPASYGQQQTTYTVPPTPAPVYASPVQTNQQASVQRNLANNQVIINNNADAVQAIQALAPIPTTAPVVVAPTPTPRAVTTYAELKAQQAPVGGGQAYIDQFLKTHNNPTVADAGN
ncbi:MAG: LysM peptidoglycan-binding domain-containing protein [Nitrospiraceae bacterium]